MRLRKNMKRTAAAVLALSMAVSAVAAPASAAYICDVSQGSVEVSVNEKGEKTITVGGKNVQKSEDDSDDIIITGDNTKATESQNAAEENSGEAGEPGSLELLAPEDEEKETENKEGEKKPSENSDEAEKPGETEAAEPGSLELLAPEDVKKETEKKPTDSQEPEQDEKTSDQVIEYDQYDPEAQKEATKPAAKPVVKQEAEEKKAAEEKTYEDNAPIFFTEKAQEAARNVVNIINNSANVLNVILRNLKVDAGDTDKSAVTIEGSGNVTLELDGKNELTGGSGSVGIVQGSGIDAYEHDYIDSHASGYTGKLTIQGKEGSSLSATGGSGTDFGGYGIRANELDLNHATVTATGGAGGAGGHGVLIDKRPSGQNSEFNIINSKLIASGGQTVRNSENTIGGYGIVTHGKVTVEAGSEVIATGGSDKAESGEAKGGNALGFFWGSYEVQEGGKLTATGGNAELGSGNATGGDALSGSGGGITSSGETTLIGGNAKSGSNSGEAAAGNAISGNNNKFSYFENVTVSKGTTTALGGKAENTDGGTATDGNGLNITMTPGSSQKTQLKVEGDGVFITAKPGKLNADRNSIADNVTIDTTGDEIKIKEVENAKVNKKDDGTVEVVGDVVGVVTGNLWYKLTETVQPTCTIPGKRVYTCATEGDHKDDTYEENIDALGHHFTVVEEVVAPTYTSEGYTIYKCENCDETEKRDVVPMLVPESNGASSGGSSAVVLTVTPAVAYETSIADGRYIIAVPAETAVLSGCLGNLRELKARDVTTIVFRTQLRETALDIDSMLSLGVDDTLFALTHFGESAELTVGGLAHNEQLR